MKKKKDKDEFYCVYGTPASMNRKYKAKNQNEYDVYGPPIFLQNKDTKDEEDDLDTIEDEG